jgi:hypothetical protein
MKLTALALALAALAAAPQDKEKIYTFPKNDVQPYEVAGELKVSFKGSHADFLEKGNDMPLKLDYRALFENVVIDPSVDGRSTRLERRVKTLKVNGEYKGDPLKVDYDAKRAEDKRFSESAGQGQLVEFFSIWCTNPSHFFVSALGKVGMEVEALNRLLVKAGMMYWEVKPDALTWDTKEKIAIPMLHNKIGLVFHNSFVRIENREGRKIMLIEAKAEISETEPPEEQAPREVKVVEPTFTASGGAKVEIDLANGRLQSLKLSVRIAFSGEGEVSNGGKGAVRGEATFTESQVYKGK